jgi:hypothetical protein
VPLEHWALSAGPLAWAYDLAGTIIGQTARRNSSGSTGLGQMRFCKLRIAWSVACSIVCVLLIVLWVRSYWYLDSFGWPPRIVTAWHGRLSSGGTVVQSPLPPSGQDPANPVLRKVLGVYVLTTQDENNITYYGTAYSVPIGLPVMLVGALAVLPWLSWHFTLRTLLIATTLVAVVLGLVVYFAH